MSNEEKLREIFVELESMEVKKFTRWRRRQSAADTKSRLLGLMNEAISIVSFAESGVVVPMKRFSSREDTAILQQSKSDSELATKYGVSAEAIRKRRYYLKSKQSKQQ